MPYKLHSLQPIIDCFIADELLSPTQIAQRLGKNKGLIHKYLKALLEQGKIKKVGLGTHVKYQLIDNTSLPKKNVWGETHLPFQQIAIISQSFYKFADNGKLLEGVGGFVERCSQRGLDPTEKATQFCKIKTHLDHIKNDCGLIEATDAFQKHVEQIYLDEIFYVDQYKRMEFGRGKLAEMTFYAKQSQNIKLINQCLDQVVFPISCLLQKAGIDAIAITPRSIVRTNQLLKILKDHLQVFGLPFIHIVKYFPHHIPIPQKSLKTREQRIRNATETIIVDDPEISQYKKILLIDDFVGSGSTLNISAKKLKDAGATQVIGCAFVGNSDLKYEIINEI